MGLNESAFYRRVVELLRAAQPFWMCRVMRVTGSAPRNSGAQMLVLTDGASEFTLGGGAMEGRVIRAALLAPASADSLLMEYHLSDLGMHCGGLMQVSLERARAADLPLFERAARWVEERRAFWFVQDAGQPSGAPLRKALLSAEGEAFGDEVLVADARSNLETLARQGQATLEAGQCFMQKVSPPRRLLVFGAGHVGAKLAEVAHAAGLFRVEVADDRAEFADAAKLWFCDRVELVAPNYVGPLPLPDLHTCVAVITRCHATDKVVLKTLLQSGKPFAYLGMIGSVPKRARLFKMLKDEGVDPDLLQRVITPMGLPIGGKQPGEIAISMLAQMIQCQNQTQEGGGSSWSSHLTAQGA